MRGCAAPWSLAVVRTLIANRLQMHLVVGRSFGRIATSEPVRTEKQGPGRRVTLWVGNPTDKGVYRGR
jgi:hypothetical protein